MRSLFELNINEGGRPARRAAPSRNVIEAFERHFGLTLPPDYVALLEHANGGHPEVDSFELNHGPEATSWAVNRFFHLDEDRRTASSLWVATETWQRVLGKKALPFASDGGGNLFFLDFGTSPPSVKVSVHDEGFRIVSLAPSFDVFIDGLIADPEMI